ncbi:MAG TPA: phosphoglycerate dehydrogenase [Candidatus Fimenecus excrementigallinarum]|uniref:D-3-phosphoglycerate dehydrogenase n=1 Tax=Candidatus Fimenecus excrementigallinarum TaxID=2840816 RepID=A0A9D1LBZ8_9FIRM|nr:phosphoglycerate dehydrogenase [Candidatus Fimenecus excrementigallinarum]
MYRILTLNKISQKGLQNFPDSYVCSGEETAPDAVLVRSASMHDMELPESLKAIARAGAGVNNIPIDRCSENGIVVFNTPGANANAVKELVLCAMLLSSRKIPAAIDWVKTLKGTGAEMSKAVEKGKSAFAGPELKGKALGVVGLGAIGVLVANAAKALGMTVYGYDPFLSVDAAWALSRGVHHSATLDEIYANCDYITLHVPLTPDTKEMVNKDSIAAMKDNVRIMNFARGDLVNTADVVDALSSGKIAAYATDFGSEELLDVPGVLVLPHLGASTPESEENCAVMAVDEIRDFLENGNITHSVNLPDVNVPRTGRARITIIHKNVPNVISKITSTVAEENINIDNMVNKSRGEYAYTMLDTDADVSAEAIEAISAVEEIVRVRVI